MPDKNPDAGPGMSNDLLRHTAPPGLKRFGRLALVAAVVIAVGGIGWRMWKSHTTAEWTDDQAIPTVQIIKLASTKAGGSLNLPGEVQAFSSAPIYAQVTGYMQKWNFDIGSKVKQGDLLAQIDPRTYQAALNQANGTLARDSATLANARLDLGRYQALAAQNAISAQQLATQQANVAAQGGIAETDRAAVQAAQINLGFTRVVAPVSGVYYPIAVLPAALRAVSYALPTAHVFEGMRALLLEGTFRYDLFRNAVLLDIAYVALGAALFAAAVHSARKRGTLMQMGE